MIDIRPANSKYAELYDYGQLLSFYTDKMLSLINDRYQSYGTNEYQFILFIDLTTIDKKINIFPYFKSSFGSESFNDMLAEFSEDELIHDIYRSYENKIRVLTINNRVNFRLNTKSLTYSAKVNKFDNSIIFQFELNTDKDATFRNTKFFNSWRTKYL